MRRSYSLSVAVLFALVACGGDSPGGGGRASGGSRDRGEASMQLGGVAWQADRAKASRDGERLTIRASHTQADGGKVARQELRLRIDDFTGPGEYRTAALGSTFVGVGFDAGAAEQGDAGEAVKDILSAAKHMTLGGARVEITAVDGGQVTGTFSWQPPAGLDKPAITSGSFRALLDG